MTRTVLYRCTVQICYREHERKLHGWITSGMIERLWEVFKKFSGNKTLLTRPI